MLGAFRDAIRHKEVGYGNIVLHSFLQRSLVLSWTRPPEVVRQACVHMLWSENLLKIKHILAWKLLSVKSQC